MHLWSLSVICSNLFRKSPVYKWIRFQTYILSKFFGTEKNLFCFQLKKKKHFMLGDFPPSCLCSFLPAWTSLNSTHSSKPRTVSSLRAENISYSFMGTEVFLVFQVVGPSFPLMCKYNSKTPPSPLARPRDQGCSVTQSIPGKHPWSRLPLVLLWSATPDHCASFPSTLAQCFQLPNKRLQRLSKC